jgi:hypothetical protein
MHSRGRIFYEDECLSKGYIVYPYTNKFVEDFATKTGTGFG